jgi:O-antigen/teichoic acid export membrane protein
VNPGSAWSGRVRTSIFRWSRGPVASNSLARVGALISLAIATVLVARVGGPSAVGVYALLRVLPGLVGVVLSAGLPGAIAYFMSGPSRTDPRLVPTLIAMAVIGGGAGALLWCASSILLADRLFVDLSRGLVIWAGVTVFSQLLVATAKSCCQGGGDLSGANWVILYEEFMFLPAYGMLSILGVHGFAAMISALVLADVTTAAFGWIRLARRGLFHAVERPSFRIARVVAGYGIRAQIGGVLTLLNLRLDFVVLSAIAGTQVLGIYAIASKFAELLKIPAMALTYVLYPRYSGLERAAATAEARSLLPRAGFGVALMAIPLGLTTAIVVPLVYGADFHAAIVPAHILLVGLAFDGLAAVVTAYLYGIGRPGLNSVAIGVGVAFTVGLDLLLIPTLGAVGAAWASTAAYVSSTLVLLAAFWAVARRSHTGAREGAVTAGSAVGAIEVRP